MNPFGPFPGLEDPQMKTRIVALETKLQQLEYSHKAHQKSTQRAFEKINKILKDMGAAINRILGKME